MGEDLQRMFDENNSSSGDSEGTVGSDMDGRGNATSDVDDMGEDLQRMFDENNSSSGDLEGTVGSDMDGRDDTTNDDVAQRPTMQDRENLENRRDDE